MLQNQLIRYGFVGAFSTLIHFVVASILVSLFYESLFFPNIAGFLIAFLWSYYAQSKFVFGSNLSKKKGVKFFIVQIISLLLAMYFASIATTIGIYLKVLMVTILLPICAFFIHKFWTFVDSN